MLRTHIYKLAAYPKDIALRDGTTVSLRPMEEVDAEALLAYFRRIPAEDRFYLKEDVTSPEVINRWAEELDYDRALPLLAWSDGKIVGDATLHRTRAGARRHIGQIRITVDTDYRAIGLGTALLHEIAAIANENELERLLLEAVEEREEQAIIAAEHVGFVKAGILPGHAKDIDGHPRDIVLLEMPLGKWFEWWEF